MLRIRRNQDQIELIFEFYVEFDLEYSHMRKNHSKEPLLVHCQVRLNFFFGKSPWRDIHVFEDMILV